MSAKSKMFPHVRPHTAAVYHINIYWHPSVSSINLGMPSPAEGLQRNMMLEVIVVVFLRPHTDSEGTITSRSSPEGTAEMLTVCRLTSTYCQDVAGEHSLVVEESKSNPALRLAVKYL